MGGTWNDFLRKVTPGHENTVLPSHELRQLAALFPSVAEGDIHVVLKLIPWDTTRQLPSGELVRPSALLSTEVCLITWQGTELELPYRVYFQEPAPGQLLGLTSRQGQLLHCLYLRHYDGYVRQRHLEALFAFGTDAPDEFTVPFTFSLVGEYVQEILVVLEQQLTPMLLASYGQLIKQNPLYWQQTRGRVASYWDVYYRRGRRSAPRFCHYVGARLLARLSHALQSDASSASH